MMRWMILAMACQLFPSLNLAQVAAEKEAAEPSRLQRWQRFYAERAAQYEISSPGDKGALFQLHPAPLLAYTNPLRGRDQHGAVFAWTRGGQDTAGRTSVHDQELPSRPELIGTVWSISMPNNPSLRRTSHEVHSLASASLHVECPAVSDPNATRAAALSWGLGPAEESLALPADATQRPFESKLRRLIQMRSIAGELEAVVIERRDGTERPLRLMPSPLMRYASPKDEVIDGCVFAFVMATDPELLVLIEAVSDPPAWRVEPIRFTGTAIRLSHQQKEIWRCEPITYADQTGPYRLRIGVSELREASD